MTDPIDIDAVEDWRGFDFTGCVEGRVKKALRLVWDWGGEVLLCVVLGSMIYRAATRHGDVQDAYIDGAIGWFTAACGAVATRLCRREAQLLRKALMVIVNALRDGKPVNVTVSRD